MIYNSDRGPRSTGDPETCVVRGWTSWRRAGQGLWGREGGLGEGVGGPVSLDEGRKTREREGRLRVRTVLVWFDVYRQMNR